MEEKSKDFMKNFAMMIPETFMAAIGDGCYINCKHQVELKNFKEWIEKNGLVQLNINDTHIDLWQMRNDLIISDGFSIAKWFNYWKENKDKKPEINYNFYSFTKQDKNE